MDVRPGRVTFNSFLTAELSKLGLQHWYVGSQGTIKSDSGAFHCIGERARLPIYKFWRGIEAVSAVFSKQPKALKLRDVKSGELAERLNAAVSKTVVVVR